MFSCSLNYYVVARAPTTLTAVYKSDTRVLVKWTSGAGQNTEGYKYVLHYQSERESSKRTFNREQPFLLHNLKIGSDYRFSILAVAHLPSTLTGPVAPGMYTEVRIPLSLRSYLSIVVEQPRVAVSGSKSATVGSSNTLTCRVTLPSGVELRDSTTPTIQWTGPAVSDVGPIQSNNGDYISILQLNPILESHEGTYTCIASYTLNRMSSESVEAQTTISVMGEFNKSQNHTYNCSINTHEHVNIIQAKIFLVMCRTHCPSCKYKR